MTTTPPQAGANVLLPQLYRAIHVSPDERVSVCHDLGGRFTATHGTAANAGGRAASFVGRANVWHSVSTLVPGIGVGRRGGREHVARVSALFTDLDVASGVRCLPDWESARRVVADLERLLGVPSPALVVTGNGVHPYWPISGGTDVHRAELVLSRFGVLVSTVCGQYGGAVDSVHEIARVLRTPGTANMKVPGHPRPVELRLRGPVDAIPLDHLEALLPELPEPPSWGVAPRPGSPVPLASGGVRPAGDAATRLRGLVQAVLDARPGERNNRLNWAAHTARELAGDLPADKVAAALATAGVQIGLSESEAAATVASGLGVRP